MKKKRPENQLSGVKEIARRAGVSIATVDRVIHNRIGVSESTRSKINGIIEDMGFQPNILASRLASKRTNRFAVLIPDANETDYWEAPRKGLERAYQEIKQYGIQLEIFLFNLNDKTTFTKQAAAILNGSFDGVVLAPSFVDEAKKFTSVCESRNLPYVFVNSDVPESKSLAYVGPNLFKSGALAGQLVRFGVKTGKVLLVNISKEIHAYHHLLRKEEGFRSYMNDTNGKDRLIQIEKVDITDTADQAVGNSLAKVLEKHPDISAIFVTNSRVRSVAGYLHSCGKDNITLIGYDLVNENIEYLRSGTIDFLIGQKPEEQGYLGLISLFQSLVMGKKIEQLQYMPIDIITSENVEFYRN